MPAGTRPLPRSLRNVFKELSADLGVPEPREGDLTPWADAGVLLLNRVLSVEAGVPGSHRRRGWERVTDRAVSALAERGGPLVAILWGKEAQTLRPLLGDTPVVESVHPSPLSASRGFFGSRPFSRTDELLRGAGRGPRGLGTALTTQSRAPPARPVGLPQAVPVLQRDGLVGVAVEVPGQGVRRYRVQHRQQAAHPVQGIAAGPAPRPSHELATEGLHRDAEVTHRDQTGADQATERALELRRRRDEVEDGVGVRDQLGQPGRRGRRAREPGGREDDRIGQHPARVGGRSWSGHGSDRLRPPLRVRPERPA